MQDAQESVCDRCGINYQPGYCKALGQICLGCGKNGHFKKMCKSGSKRNWSYRRNRSSRRTTEETSEGSSGSDDEDDYPTRLGKLRVRKTRPRFSQVEDVSRRREEMVDNASIQTYPPLHTAQVKQSNWFYVKKPVRYRILLPRQSYR